MRVLLKGEIGKLGKKGDLVEVSDGFARNFLLPHNLAEIATAKSIQRAKLLKEREEKRREKHQAMLQDLAQRLKKIKLDIKKKAGKDGRTFGSVTAREVVIALKNQFQIELNKQQIEFSEPIRSTGKHIARIRLDGGITSEVTIEVSS